MSALPGAAILRAALARHGTRPQCIALGEAAGVPEALVLRAIQGRAINAKAHVRLCAALQLDPATGAHAVPLTAGEFDWIMFALAIKARRFKSEREGIRPGLRPFAKHVGTSLTTLSRAENNYPISAEGMIAICRAIDAQPFDFLKPVQPCVSRVTTRGEARAAESCP